MAANFEGGNNAIPGAYASVETLSRGVSIPSGSRLAVIIGEGARELVLVSSAVGDGLDGLNSTYTSSSGSDGRHFLLPDAPVVTNRTVIYKNGVQLAVLEGTVDGSAFDSRFNVKLEIATGKLELQGAYLVDQGGALYRASATNTGDGTINGISLIDANAPEETWTVKCLSVRRDGYGDPIDGYARFIATGTISGTLLDGYGNQVVWQSNGTVTNNTVLSFSITEGSTAFREGDAFVVQTAGGALKQGDSLTAQYIAEIDMNDPEFFTDINALRTKHGSASTSNTIALGAQIMFANGTPGLYAIQAAPPLPRRVSYLLMPSASGDADADDLTFTLPLNVTPDVDSNINFFITDTDGTESQLIPNKVAFYNATYTASPSTFIFGTDVFSYTVVLEDSVQKSGEDGELTSTGPTTATLSSDSVLFDSNDLGVTRSINIINATNAANNGVATISSVSEGVVTISKGGGFVTESSIDFQVLDSSATSARILFTDDLVLTAGQSLRATVVDTRDASFFDANWSAAYDAAEKIDIDMVVPLPTQTKSAIFQAGKSHVIAQSQVKVRHERMLFIGALSGLEPEHVLGTELAAVEDIGILEGIQGDDVNEVLAGTTEDLSNYSVQDAFGDTFRVVYMYPDEVVVQIGADRTVVDGFYMAPAAAAFFTANNSINIPLTNKTLTGFTILRDKLYAPITLENLTAGGMTVLQPVSGGGRVIWGKTTTLSGYAEEEEISVVFIRDRIAKNMRSAFRGFVGVAESPTFAAELFARATAVMQSFLSQRLITDYKDLTVLRDSVEPRQWNISVSAQPVYPVNYIYARVSIGLF